MSVLNTWVPEMQGRVLEWLEYTGEVEIGLEKQRGQLGFEGLCSLWEGMVDSKLYFKG